MSEQTTPTAAPGPQTATRFDQVISQEADSLVADLVKRHPELRGAAIIFDWDLPRSSIGPLPAGAWRTKDALVTPDKCYGMQHQLARFMNHMSKTILRMMDEATTNYRAMTAAMQSPTAQELRPPNLDSVPPPQPAPPAAAAPAAVPVAPPVSATAPVLQPAQVPEAPVPTVTQAPVPVAPAPEVSAPVVTPPVPVTAPEPPVPAALPPVEAPAAPPTPETTLPAAQTQQEEIPAAPEPPAAPVPSAPPAPPVPRAPSAPPAPPTIG